MPRVKRPTKKSRGASSSMEPPPQDHPLAQWFYNKEDFDLYLSNFASRKVVPPRYLEPNFFDQHQYPNLLGILVRQNLVNCMKIKDSYYPDLIAIAYTTLYVEFEEDDLVFSFKLGKNTYTLESSELSATWKLDYVGEKVDSGNANLSQANKKKLGYNHCIDTHVLNHMKRNVHEAPQQEEEAQPQEPQAQPSEQPSDQPSLRDIMQAIQTMELNMNQRMEKIDKNQARMLRKIRRVEAYTFSEDEAEDDDDDFWS
ncbi:hypothetical protein PIB30_107070 [Stylosanthes scabra]|uniref:Uncharacterized protein n=1 Tax=Stylosanthes scabra TaxID=79078 RepID=A0ABU6SZG8_9FABA|nr:hypothetical protein [Stylosanthes scabra]